MKFQRIFFVLLLFCLSLNVHAQRRNYDYGILVGTAQYNGDVNMTKPYYSPQPAASFIFRKNYNPHYSLRFNATFALLRANDANFDNTYQQNRNYFFKDTKIMEFSSILEYNFFEVNNKKKEKNLSPYVVFGLGMMYIENSTWYEFFNIPMGLGIKYKLLPRLELRGEWVFRKTFTDKLDQLAYQANDGYLEYQQISCKETNDWFSILGISLLFNISEDEIPCPVYEMRTYPHKRK